MPVFPVARVEIQDVNLTVIFLDPIAPMEMSAAKRMEVFRSLEPLCRQQGFARDVIAVWQDEFGRTRFLAPPQQHAFFQAVSYLQLRAQVNDSLAAPD